MTVCAGAARFDTARPCDQRHLHGLLPARIVQVRHTCRAVFSSSSCAALSRDCRRSRRNPGMTSSPLTCLAVTEMWVRAALQIASWLLDSSHHLSRTCLLAGGKSMQVPHQQAIRLSDATDVSAQEDAHAFAHAPCCPLLCTTASILCRTNRDAQPLVHRATLASIILCASSIQHPSSSAC